MKGIAIDWSDGRYTYRILEDVADFDRAYKYGWVVIDVPDEFVELWSAVGDLDEVVQRQLCALDDLERDPARTPLLLARVRAAAERVHASAEIIETSEARPRRVARKEPIEAQEKKP